MRQCATDRYAHSKHKLLLLNQTAASFLCSPKLLVLDMWQTERLKGS